jgi:hypothetical protein
MRFTSDRRPPIEQVKSGLKIAGAITSSVAAIALFGLAYVQISNAGRPLTGWLIMIGLATSMALTVQYWRRWFFFVPTYLGLRSSLWLLLGWFSPGGYVLVIFPVLMLAMAVMSFRFRQITGVRASDRAVLLFAAACLLASLLQLFSETPSAMALLFAALGDSVLFVSRFYPPHRPHRRAQPDSAPST